MLDVNTCNWVSCIYMGCNLPLRSIPPTNGSVIINVFKHCMLLSVNNMAQQSVLWFLTGLYCLCITEGEIKDFLHLLNFLKHALHLNRNIAYYHHITIQIHCNEANIVMIWALLSWFFCLIYKFTSCCTSDSLSKLD